MPGHHMSSTRGPKSIIFSSIPRIFQLLCEATKDNSFGTMRSEVLHVPILFTRLSVHR